MKQIKKLTQTGIHAVRTAYHRRRIAQIQRKMERQYLRGAPLCSERMVRWSVLISQHSIFCE